MRNKILIPFFLLIVTLCFSQEKITWADLAHVKFTEKYFPDYDDSFLFPEFLPAVKALQSKKITIKGYFLSPDGDLTVLSKGPMASCYFCGAGGPETAMELQFKDKPSFKTDDVIEVTGTFWLNDTDVNHFNYILRHCTAKKAAN